MKKWPSSLGPEIASQHPLEALSMSLEHPIANQGLTDCDDLLRAPTVRFSSKAHEFGLVCGPVLCFYWLFLAP